MKNPVGHALAFAVCLGIGVSLAGCATFFPPEPKPMHGEKPPGRWHEVKAGETLSQIAEAAGVPVQDLMELNGIASADRIEVGQFLYVLEASADRSGEPTAAPDPEGRPVNLGPRGESSRLRVPVQDAVLSSQFGPRWGRQHEGVDYAAPTGTPIYAAANGRVIYAGDEVRGYGNMLVVQHSAVLLTVYAHASVLLVQVGDQVARGQMIARVGESGKATAPHLHFEVRDNDVPRDPLPYFK
ncbi:MAG: M23 family metallopeptidase [Deltaproteobacteria bacterium]|nr:M23 family metallopeptidase [Deltaproteobacteria bacterium]